MSRSYRQTPITNKKNVSCRWDKNQSTRQYRRFVKDRIAHEDYDSIHNKHKTFWDRWSWTLDISKRYFGDYQYPKLGYGIWEYFSLIEDGKDPEEVLEKVL